VQQVLELLKEKLGVALQEHHLTPLLDAYCFHKKVPEAIAFFDMLRASSITPTIFTAQPLVEVLQDSISAIDQAYSLLEERASHSKPVDLALFNTVVKASVKFGDLQRAVGTYKAAATMNVAPNIDTYNILLTGCIAAEHSELGERLLAEMRAAGLNPDERTYERLVILALTQPSYEAAFFYLEEMKGFSYQPSPQVYEALASKCAFAKDARANLVLQEMEESGYKPTGYLRRLVETKGEVVPDRTAGSTDGATAVMVDEKRKAFRRGTMHEMIDKLKEERSEQG